jgi:outer membrane beta-barrel protein
MVFTLKKEFRVRKLVVLFASLFFLGLQAHAITIEFPEDELAKESVLPVFEGGTVAVKSRRVVTKKKIELGVLAGMVFNEPYFSPLTYGIHAGYHFNEFHSIGVNAFMRNSSPSSDANEIDSKASTRLGFNYMPAVKYFATVDYQLTPYYGKISLSKETVMNLLMYVYGGAGMIGLDGYSTWIANVGVGQNLFFTPRIGLRADLKFLMYQGLNYTSRPGVAPTSAVSASELDKQFNISPSVMLGVVVLL